MAVRQVLGFVGAAVGAYFGNPQLGYAIGSAIGNVVDPLVLRGPAIGDLAQQTAQEGAPRPIVFALSPPMAGNIIASGPPRIVKKKKSQGKGGPKVVTQSIFRTYAIGVCEGPITRFVRVWRNGELVFDRSGEFNYYDLNADGNPDTGLDLFKFAVRTISNNLTWEQKARYFLGGYDQNASPDLETVFGVGTTPAHRGTAYMVIRDDDLTDLRGAIPQYMFQVERCEGYFLTSEIYSLEDQAALNITGAMFPKTEPVLFEDMAVAGALVSGELDQVLIQYTDGDPEALDVAGGLVSGELDQVLIQYTDGDPEALDVAGAMQSGSLEVKLLTYEDGDPEALDVAGSLISGTLI